MAYSGLPRIGHITLGSVSVHDSLWCEGFLYGWTTSFDRIGPVRVRHEIRHNRFPNRLVVARTSHGCSLVFGFLIDNLYT